MTSSAAKRFYNFTVGIESKFYHTDHTREVRTLVLVVAVIRTSAQIFCTTVLRMSCRIGSTVG